jgi:hypothetical protein
MKITARGWKRDSGPSTIVDHDISEARPDPQNTYYPNILYLDRTSKGVKLLVGPAVLSLGGKYQLNITLTDEDIVRLLLEIQPELRSSLGPVFGQKSVGAVAAE